jgi:hypothetical protein
MSEYYIKQPQTDNSRGPLNLEQLVSMAETGVISEDTLLYDEISEKWRPFNTYSDLLPMVFPERKTLSLNRLEAAPTEDHVASEIAQGKLKPKVSTEDLLAAAQGETKETRHIGQRKASTEKAAELAAPGIGTLLAISAIALIFPAKDTVIEALSTQSALFTVLLNPLLILGLLLAACSVGVYLGLTEVFPLLRILGAASVGMLLYLFWAWQNPLFAACGAMMGTGLFLSTLASRQSWMLFSLLIGIAGASILAYHAISGNIAYP